MPALIAACAAGLIFALGLGLAGMTDPARIVGFLDVFGAWDPSLLFVMAGAVGVHFAFFRLAMRRRSPLLAPRFLLPVERPIDARLIAGAAIFGVGWGVSGYCPGPAVVSIASGRVEALAFVAAMVAGMVVAGVWAGDRHDETPDANDACG